MTGIKRDIELLQRVDAKVGDRVTVLDISLDKNRAHLKRILETGAEVLYIDHHYAGEIPASVAASMINEAPDVCTSLLVNQYLRGAFTHWAVVGTFGDNLKKSAHVLAKKLQLNPQQLDLLENLGIFINYNGYGSELDELHYQPQQLFQQLLPYSNPLDFIEDSREHYQKLEAGYQSDLQAAESAERLVTNKPLRFTCYLTKPGHGVSGVFSNQLANQFPDRAHAVLTTKSNGNYLVSVRAPLNNKQGAATLCRQFATGGGREAAAGINNDLPADKLHEFIDRFAPYTYRNL